MSGFQSEKIIPCHQTKSHHKEQSTSAVISSIDFPSLSQNYLSSQLKDSAEYLLTRFASAGSMFWVASFSPSASSSSDCSPDDPLVVDFTWAPDFLDIAGRGGTPTGPPASLSCSFDESCPLPIKEKEIQTITMKSLKFRVCNCLLWQCKSIPLTVSWVLFYLSKVEISELQEEK